MNNEEKYNQVLEEATSDPNIIGLILAGGRGKGVVTENSDYDIFMIVPDENLDEYKEKYKEYSDTSGVYVYLMSIAEFRKYAEIGSDSEWDRYNFTHVKAQVDKTGEIQKLIDEKGKLPKDKVYKIVAENLDAYINLYYRSLKEDKDGNQLASKLNAAESFPFLLTALFALQERVRPYNKYLEWELKKEPLKIPWSADEFIAKLQKIIEGDIETQKEVFQVVKKVFIENGYNKEIDKWMGIFWINSWSLFRKAKYGKLHFL